MTWTIDFFRRWLPRMSIGSTLKLRRHLLDEQRGYVRPSGATIDLALRRPINALVRLRRTGSDFATFAEIVENEVYAPVLERCHNIETVVDLGANIGLASLYFACHYPKSRILAVEPNPETFRLLDHNLQPLIRSGRAATFQGAVWSSKAALSGSCSPSRFSGFMVSEKLDNATDPIQAITMQEIFSGQEISNVLVKADIEGAEVQLFSDSSWLDRVKALAIEFHADSRRKSGFDDLMRRHGFSVTEFPHTTIALR